MAKMAGSACSQGQAMMLFEYALSLSSAVLPKLQVQQVFHATGWLAVLTWLSVQFIRVYDKRWRWLIVSLCWLLVLMLWQAPLSNLGLAFQTPSLLTLCLCVNAAWQDIKGRSHLLFYTAPTEQAHVWIWLLPAIAGWVLCLDTFGLMLWDIYSMGFEQPVVWLAWGVMGVWMACIYLFALAGWQMQAVNCWLVATALFVATHAPSGNVWDAWSDPGLWIWAHIKLIQFIWRQRTRINHS
jgi:hypothetical protein